MKKEIYKFDDVELVKRFIVGGKAIITLESKKTGRWFTYKIKLAKKDVEDSPYFVSVLTGVDNEKSYTYMGTIFCKNGRQVFRRTGKSSISEDALSFKAFNFFFNLLLNNKIHPDMSIYHSGICARCARKLTVPESLITGYGPECRSLSEKSVSDIRKSKLQNINRKVVK